MAFVSTTHCGTFCVTRDVVGRGILDAPFPGRHKRHSISEARHRRRPGGPGRYSAPTFRACGVIPMRATRGAAAPVTKLPGKLAAMHGRSLPCLYSPPPPWTPGPGPAGPGGFPAAFDTKSGAPAGQARPRGSPGKWNAGGWYPPLRAWQLSAPRGVDTPANERRVRDAAPYRVRLGEGGSV